MSVFTAVSRDELHAFLSQYSVGDLVDFQGISAGVENTNYFVTTTTDTYVLTLFEHLQHDELPFYLDLMAFMAEHGVPSAHPVADKDASYLRTLAGKPAALVNRLTGKSNLSPSVAHCRTLGTTLGRLHRLSQDFNPTRENASGPHWWRTTLESLLPHLDPADIELATGEVHYQASFRNSHLPRGVIHADLFRDNALFVDEDLTGLIDFYQACTDVLLYDVAITANDWCSQPDGTLDTDKACALLHGYQLERPLNDDEKSAWPTMLRAGALRFWLSRLRDLHFPREGDITHTKDPNEYRDILRARIQSEAAQLQCWP